MTKSQLEGYLFTLDHNDVLTFVSRLAWALTVAARGTYAIDGVGVADPKALRDFNEILHRITAAVRDIISEVKIRDQISMVVDYFPENAKNEHEKEVEWAYVDTMTYMQKREGKCVSEE
jgi:nitric oxide synthase oxygenase domain/subunit